MAGDHIQIACRVADAEEKTFADRIRGSAIYNTVMGKKNGGHVWRRNGRTINATYYTFNRVSVGDLID